MPRFISILPFAAVAALGFMGAGWIWLFGAALAAVMGTGLFTPWYLLACVKLASCEAPSTQSRRILPRYMWANSSCARCCSCSAGGPVCC